jgi:4-amino-4-deoxy-L-arabinose transferase-like glycosyltransferase
MRGLALQYGEAALLALLHYAALALVGALAWLYGRRLTARLRDQTKLEGIVFSLAIGLGAIAYLILLLGLLRLLYAPVLGGLLLLGALLCRGVWRDWPAEFRRRSGIRAWLRRRPVSIATTVIALLLLAPLLVLPLYPPTQWDSTALHLASAKIYAARHALVFTTYLRYPVFPQANQMLFTGALMLGDDLLAQLIEWLMLAMLAAALIACGERHLTQRAGWWGAALLLSNPIVLLIGSVAYVDVALVLYIFLGVYAFWNWFETKERAWLVMSGVLLGLAFGVKYPAMFFILLLTAVAFLTARGKERLTAPLLFGGLAFAVALPWLARNLYYTGNPLFPFYYELFAPLFGYSRWSREYLGSLLENRPGRGVARTLWGLLRLPWALTTNQPIFEAEAPISPFYLPVLPLTIIAAIRRRGVRLLLMIAAIYTLFWWGTYQILRYLMPAFPFFSLAAGGALDAIFTRVSQMPAISATLRMPNFSEITLRRAWTILVAVVLLWPGLKYSIYFYRQAGPPPADAARRDLYLANKLPTYPLYQFLNRWRGRDYTVYSLYNENLFYYADGTMMGDWFGPASFDRIRSRIKDGESLYQELRRLGADHLLIDFARIGRQTPPQDEAFRQRFRPLLVRAGAALFDLGERPLERSTGDNLLVNPGFEEGDGEKAGGVIGWSPRGGPRIDRSMPYAGQVAVLCEGAADGFLQRVTVQPGAIYRLRYAAQAEAAGSSARLQIAWVSANGIQIGPDLQVVNLAREWRIFETDVIAPPGAAQAVVEVAPQTGGRVRFDEVFLGEVTFREGGPQKTRK